MDKGKYINKINNTTSKSDLFRIKYKIIDNGIIDITITKLIIDISNVFNLMFFLNIVYINIYSAGISIISILLYKSSAKSTANLGIIYENKSIDNNLDINANNNTNPGIAIQALAAKNITLVIIPIE